MISKGFGTVIEELEASIQSKVGEFLSLKQKLLTMQKSPLITVSDKAKELYAVQIKLETDLSDALRTIESVKKDTYTLSDITKTSVFYYYLNKQIGDVSDLETQYVAAGAIAVPPSDWSSWALIAGGFALIYMLIGRK